MFIKASYKVLNLQRRKMSKNLHLVLDSESGETDIDEFRAH